MRHLYIKLSGSRVDTGAVQSASYSRTDSLESRKCLVGA